MKRAFSSSLLFALAFSVGGAEESLRAERVRVSWVAPRAFGVEATSIGVRFVPDPGWHLYWKNPGDSGAEPRFSFDTEGADMGDVQWPYPARMPYGDMVNLGYESEVIFPLRVAPHGGASSVRVEARLEWVVCKEECIAGFGNIVLERPVRAIEKWRKTERTRLARFESRVPRVAKESPWTIAGARVEGGVLIVDLLAKGGSVPDAPPAAFPTDGDAVLPQAPRAEEIEGGYRLAFRLLGGAAAFSETGFVLVEGGAAWEFPSVPIR